MDGYGYPTAQQIISEYLRQLDEGIAVTESDVMRRHAALATELRKEFRKLQELRSPLDSVGTTITKGDTRTVVRCPHCNEAVDVTITESLKLFACHACRNEFSLLRERKWPSVIDHFELIERLGMGGFGTVWKARDLQLDRFVALKLPRQRNIDENDGAHFLQEARTAAQLDHPNIVKVHEVGTHDDFVYIATELIEGEPLSLRIGNGLPEAEALPMAELLAQALVYAHSKRVIHRDIKPQNVLIDKQGQPHLSDFGLAGHSTTDVTLSLQSSEQAFGTPSYMSPEQARSQAVDERSDIYSFGVLLYETLTGQVPFQGTLPNVIRRLDSEDPINPKKLNDRISRDLDTICMKCMEKTPERRYQSAAELVSELQCVMDNKPITARPVSNTERLVRWAKRNPMIATVSTVACAAFLIAAFLLLSLNAQRKITAVETRHSVIAQLKEIINTGNVGYRTESLDLIRQRPEMLADQDFRATVRQIVVGVMGDFAGYKPVQLAASDIATTGDHKEVLIASAAITSDGQTVALGYLDGRIEIFDANATWTSRQVLDPEDDAHAKDYPMCLRFPPDSKNSVIAISHQGVATRHTWTSGKSESQRIVRFQMPPIEKEDDPPVVNGAAISPNATRLAICHNQAVEVYDVQQQATVLSTPLDDLGDAVPRNVSVGDTFDTVAVGYSDDLGSVGGIVTLQIGGEQGSPIEFNTGRQYENGIALDPTGSLVLVGTEQTTIFDIQSRQSRQRFMGSEATAVAFGPHQNYLAIGYIGGVVDIRHRKSHTKIATLQCEKVGRRFGVTFCGNGKRLLIWNEQSVQYINLGSDNERLSLAGHQRGIPALRFTRDGEQLLSTGKDGYIYIWNTHTGEKQKQHLSLGSQVQCVDLDPEERWMATAKWGTDPKLSIWSFPDYKEVLNVPHGLKNICGLRFSPQRNYLAAIGDDGLRLWSVTVENEKLTLNDYMTESATTPVDEEKQESESTAFAVDNAAEEPAGKLGKFLMFDSPEKRLYYVDNWAHLRWLEIAEKQTRAFQSSKSRDDLYNGFNSLAFTPEGYVGFVSPLPQFEAWDIVDGEKQDRRMLTLPISPVDSTITINRHGFLAGMLDEKTVGIWNLNTRELIYRLRPEASGIWSLAWSPTENRLAVGLADGGLSIWNFDAIHKQLRSLGLDE